ncbi:hypothetical protein D3C76_1476960 [compost metagenome]
MPSSQSTPNREILMPSSACLPGRWPKKRALCSRVSSGMREPMTPMLVAEVLWAA